MDNAKLRAPFAYFGGKASVASDVWAALGQPKHYIEPFCGSCAVLLARPDYDPETMVETVNDADGHIANVWRSIQFSPDETAQWCDWPVNHADLMARKAELNRKTKHLLNNLVSDPKWHDAELAGYYIWAASCWIGHGLVSPGQIPHLGTGGMGVHKISLGARPHLSDAGKGINGKTKPGVYYWLNALSERLRNVRVVCGDWQRVCGGDWQDKMGNVGMFFDPPYGVKANRYMGIYAVDSGTVADDVRDWCLKRGEKKSYRIVLAGYYEEHEELLSHNWRVKRWKAQGGYGNLGNGQGKENRHKEALFFSPFCLDNELPLFKGTAQCFD